MRVAAPRLKALPAECPPGPARVACQYIPWYTTDPAPWGAGEEYTVSTALRSLLLLCALALGVSARAGEPSRVFAAASLTNALTDIGALWQKAGHPAPVLDFAASSTLAKQIEAGAP